MDGEVVTVESVTKLLFILTRIHFDTVQLAVQVSILKSLAALFHNATR